MNNPTKEQWRELSAFSSSISLHHGDLMRAISDKEEWDVIQAYKDLQKDLDDILLWIKGGQAANITEKGDK